MTNVPFSRDVGDGFDFIGLDLRKAGSGAIAQAMYRIRIGFTVLQGVGSCFVGLR